MLCSTSSAVRLLGLPRIARPPQCSSSPRGSPALQGASIPSSPANGKSPSGKGLVRVRAAVASPAWQVLGQELCMVAPAVVTG